MLFCKIFLHIKNGEENQQIATLQVIDIYKVTGITLIQLSSIREIALYNLLLLTFINEDWQEKMHLASTIDNCIHDC